MHLNFTFVITLHVKRLVCKNIYNIMHKHDLLEPTVCQLFNKQNVVIWIAKDGYIR